MQPYCTWHTMWVWSVVCWKLIVRKLQPKTKNSYSLSLEYCYSSTCKQSLCYHSGDPIGSTLHAVCHHYYSDTTYHYVKVWSIICPLCESNYSLGKFNRFSYSLHNVYCSGLDTLLKTLHSHCHVQSIGSPVCNGDKETMFILINCNGEKETTCIHNLAVDK